MKTTSFFSIATLPRSGVWGADDCGEPNNLLAASDKCQEKLPQQFSSPKSDFLVWGRSPCAVASRQTKRGYPRQRESEIALRRDSNRSGIFRQEKSCDEGGSRALRGAPQAKRGVQKRWRVQQQVINTRRATSSGGNALFIHPLLGILKLEKANFKNKKCCLTLPQGIAIEHCTYKYIGTNNGN